MSRALQYGSVPLALKVIRGFSSCDGPGVIIGLKGASSCSSTPFSAPVAAIQPGSAGAALAALLREREADGHQDLAVVLELNEGRSRVTRGNVHWVAEAISWLGRHGRRTVVRTDRVLPRTVVDAARDAGAAVVLRLASHDPKVQTALLGPTADSASRLLLGAQHLRAQGVPVAVLIAPLLPVLHRDSELEALARNIAAADLDKVSFAIGGWSPSRHRALGPCMPAGGAAGLARAFRVYEPDLSSQQEGTSRPSPDTARVRLGVREATLLQRQARRIAEEAGLTVGGCGCAANCDLGAGPSDSFQSLLAPDLFGALAG